LFYFISLFAFFVHLPIFLIEYLFFTFLLFDLLWKLLFIFFHSLMVSCFLYLRLFIIFLFLYLSQSFPLLRCYLSYLRNTRKIIFSWNLCLFFMQKYQIRRSWSFWLVGSKLRFDLWPSLFSLLLWWSIRALTYW
jgi:hypothetical protein